MLGKLLATWRHAYNALSSLPRRNDVTRRHLDELPVSELHDICLVYGSDFSAIVEKSKFEGVLRRSE